MQNIADIFKVLGDPIRLRLAILLANEGETCVCMLAHALDEPEFKISRHLGIMRSVGIAKSRRQGTWMYYQLINPRHGLDRSLQKCLQDCLTDNETVKADLSRLKKATCHGPNGKIK